MSLGADPKSVLCAFFKSGTCGKGNKCKFSHDLSLERKSEKRSIYVDERDQDKKGIYTYVMFIVILYLPLRMFLQDCLM